MRTIAFMNLKGGTGKTTSAINTAAILAKDYGQTVLLVDADSQANMTEFVSLSLSPACGLAEMLTGKPAFPMPTTMKDVKIIKADETLMALDIHSAGSGEADPMALADFLDREDIRSEYDFCLIDCPPAFNAGAMAALIAADEVIIPLKLDAFGIRGIRNLLEQIRNMRRINSGLTVTGVLPTMYYPSDLQAEAETELKKALRLTGIQVFHWIRRSAVPVDRMTFLQKPLIVSSPKSGACRDYRVFVGSLMKGGEQRV